MEQIANIDFFDKLNGTTIQHIVFNNDGKTQLVPPYHVGVDDEPQLSLVEWMNSQPFSDLVLESLNEGYVHKSESETENKRRIIIAFVKYLKDHYPDELRKFLTRTTFMSTKDFGVGYKGVLDEDKGEYRLPTDVEILDALAAQAIDQRIFSKDFSRVTKRYSDIAKKWAADNTEDPNEKNAIDGIEGYAYESWDDQSEKLQFLQDIRKLYRDKLGYARP